MDIEALHEKRSPLEHLIILNLFYPKYILILISDLNI